MGLLAYLFGLYGIAGVSIDIGKLLLLVFVIFATISFVGAITIGKSEES
jgi:uncharacterized membrane protein YtjA (UPF0391 family)